MLALMLAFGLGGGVLFDRIFLLDAVPRGAAPDFRLIAQAWNEIQRHYVGRASLTNSMLTYGAISGMVNALGDTGHSTFLSPHMVDQLQEDQKGRLKGIGIEIAMHAGHVVIVAPIDGSPAQKAGLRAGEIIMRVDGREITDLPLNQVVARITGPVGTKVHLTILDPHTGHLRDVDITRASIKLHSISWHPLPGTSLVHLRISEFEEHTGTEIRKALDAIMQKKPTGIILDLRNNPGGILDQAVAAASQFLCGGNVLLVKNANGTTQPVPVKQGGIATNAPIAVLINRGSASGAEIVAGALKDANRGTLIGETTFGTGTVLKEFPLFDGSSLLLAVQEWLTPDGHSFWHKGITPDIAVNLPPDTNLIFPGAEHDMTAKELKDSGDKQLLRAEALLTGQEPIKQTPVEARAVSR